MIALLMNIYILSTDLTVFWDFMFGVCCCRVFWRFMFGGFMLESVIVDVIDSLMSFFLSLFQGLLVQMGVPFTEQTIQTFMTLFTQYVAFHALI